MKSSEGSPKKRIFAIILFYAIAVLIRYLTNKTGLLDRIDNSFLKICIQGVGPTIGALVAIIIFGLKPTYSFAGKLKPLLVSAFIFVVIPVIGFAVIGVKESEHVIVSSNAYLAGAKLCFYFLIYAILEEIGWRAFLQEQLGFLNQYLKYAVIGVLWFIWHLNFELTVSNLIFLLVLILASWGIGKVGDKTKSILAVGAFHALYNLFTVAYFDSKGKIIVLSVSAVIWILYVVLYDKMAHKVEPSAPK
ncbi:MAG: CPBP family intramembrane metalloprotease [Desulfobacter postgatei]|jgi:membrane protease YdiL (CAAX protease family)|uniref:CPBP family intramembrane glutamic endopeptidase n=1 Tax=Desulfobacter postgatei TaxID=2293 RepID=UPI0023F45BDD|nr:CPBP family intramembrane glutamic endopeptidase [Desulfobacter postgatei]MDD4275016.1 CPBP family intramembrane metalloprotease [Desulfobacter postgatei]